MDLDPEKSVASQLGKGKEINVTDESQTNEDAEVLDIPALRDALDTSRKYLIPLLEHLDAAGLTVLRGGVRRLLASSDLNRSLASDI